MEKQFSSKQIANFKRIRQNVESDLTKLERINKKIETLQTEADQVKQLIDLQEQPVKIITGYTTQELFNKVVTEVGINSDGYPIRRISYELKYPDTFIPPINEEVNANYSDINYNSNTNE